MFWVYFINCKNKRHRWSSFPFAVLQFLHLSEKSTIGGLQFWGRTNQLSWSSWLGLQFLLCPLMSCWPQNAESGEFVCFIFFWDLVGVYSSCLFCFFPCRVCCVLLRSWVFCPLWSWPVASLLPSGPYAHRTLWVLRLLASRSGVWDSISWARHFSFPSLLSLFPSGS